MYSNTELEPGEIVNLMNVKMSNTVVSLGALWRRCHQCVHCCLRQQSWRTLATHASEDLPRITTPHKMQAHLQKLMQRQQTQATVKKQSFRSPVVISCKRNNFNHHRGQTYSDFGPQTLASYGWKNRKSAGDFFTVLCHDKNPALLSKGTDNSFDDLHLDRDIVRAVQALGFSVPTNVQMSAIPAILRGGSTLCAAETGSGKTLAYLLPALNMLLQRRESTALVEESVNTPSIIILTPTRELADQVMGVAESLQQYLHFTVYSVCGGRGTKARLVWPVKRPMDIIISTPGVLRKLLIAGQIRSSALQQIILDEADTLLDDSFVDTVDRILHRLKIPTMSVPGDAEAGMISPGREPANNQSGFVGGVQFVLVSATMPRGLEKTLGAYVPVESLEKVTGLGLHRLMPHVPQKFLRLLPSQKSEELVKLVRQTTAQTAGSVMVFCNSSSTSFYLGHILEENGVQPAIINGEMTEKCRRGVFERFQDGHHNILVATDIASRGLDTINVCHVVNYDFPSFVSDYIHRAGRVGRVGSSHSGRVTSFVAHKWEVEVLWQIEIAARKSADIYNVNANIKRKLLSEYAKRHGMSPDEL